MDCLRAVRRQAAERRGELAYLVFLGARGKLDKLRELLRDAS